MNHKQTDKIAKAHVPWALDEQAEWEMTGSNYDKTDRGLKPAQV
jgi:hypothetical protein